MKPQPEKLAAWLAYLESLHPRTIELGLERIGRVRERLQLDPAFPVITVGGTNGKGSTCAMLEAVLGAAGYRVGLYTSPHLLRYNERVRIQGVEAKDAVLCQAFAAVEAARGDIPLTYFEFGTLAALLLFVQEQVDAAVLEVGLGGRLDAVNVFAADCAVLTSVALDHMDYLGDSREAIGFEKAGIFRSGRPAICAEAELPHSVARHAAEIGAGLRLIGRDFGYEPQPDHWLFWSKDRRIGALPYPGLRGAYQLSNASACLAALEALGQRLPVPLAAMRQGLLQATLPGRFQVLPGCPRVILDVAHNPHAAHALAGNLARMAGAGRNIAVLGMLADKDIAGVIAALQGLIDVWLLAQLDVPRGAAAPLLLEALRQAGLAGRARSFADVGAAFAHACHMAGENDKIIAFGSFHTVAQVVRQLARD